LSAQVDAWAVGVCLTIVLTGRLPFEGEDLDAIKTAAQTPINFEMVPWRFLSPDAVDLARRLLQVSRLPRLSLALSLVLLPKRTFVLMPHACRSTLSSE
jgi:serine/threonine protein kinase